MKNLKKILSFILAFCVITSGVPMVLAAESPPVMEAYNAASSGDYHKYYNAVYSVTFLNKIDTAAINNAIDSWDVSANKDGSVMAWMNLNEEATAEASANRYDVYIAGEGGVTANPDSSYIFYCFSKLKEINGLENFKTDNVTTFNRLFEKCSSLVKVDLSSFNTSNLKTMNYMFTDCSSLIEVNFANWDTSNVTSMTYVFKNCKVIPEIDISSFNTKNVTAMTHLFYNCHELAIIYVGPGWTVENVVNGDAVFNCCYALMGGKENYDNGKTNIDFADTLTTPDTEKPQPEIKKYTVTYEFTGDVPESVTLPVTTEYDENTTVTVADVPAVDGYIFSGWTSENTDIASGTFTLTENVVIKGHWTRINYYTVTYLYEGDIPSNAPIFEEKTYEENSVVTLENNPVVDGYVFSGWTSADTDLTNGEFALDRNVTITGRWTKLYTVTYQFTGDVPANVKLPEIVEAENGTKITVANVPTADGYVFSGWTTSDTTVINNTFTLNNNVVFTGHWTKLYTVTYQFTGDVPTNVKLPETIVAENGSTITVTNVPAANGYVFSGWVSSDADLTNGTFALDRNVTITGHWTKLYTITYQFTGNIPTDVKLPAITEAKTGEKLTVADVPTADGYVFSGWTTTDATVTNNTFTLNNNVVFTGHWTKLYTVNYEFTGNVPANIELPETVVAEDGSTITIANVPAAEGYVFSGWTSSDADITNGSFILENDVVITGHWTKLYNVIYKFTGNIPADVTLPESFTAPENTMVTVENNPVVDGYIFSGWTTEDVNVENNSFVLDRNVVIVGHWTKLYTVTYKFVGNIPAGVVGTSYEYVANTNITTDAAPYVEGYEFTGWTSDDVVIANEKFVMPESDVVIYGSYKKLVTDITVTPENTTVNVGDKFTLDITIKPSDATNKEVIFETNNDVVSVDEKGNVVANKEGTAIVTVTSKENPEIKNTIKIIVKIPVENIEIKTEIPELVIGEKTKIEVDVMPKTATNKGLDFESDNEYVVEVDNEGVLTPNNEGEATITITSRDNKNVRAEVGVTVKSADPILNKYEVTYKFNGPVPEGIELPASFEEYENTRIIIEKNPVADGYEFSGWSTNDAEVINNAFILTNDVTITGSWTKLYNVRYEYRGTVPANAPKLNTYAFKAGENVVVNNAPTVKGYNFVGWTTEDVTVTDNNFVMPEKDVILYGHFEKIIVPVTNITANNINIAVGEKKQIKASVNSDATDKTLTYASTDTNIAVVDANGNVTGIAPGETTIKITAANGIEIFIVVTVMETLPMTHHVVFGKTDGIGWYLVSRDGGKTFETVFGNSTYEVAEGETLVIKCGDIMGESFTFYINGDAVKPDENGCITITVHGYMLIGALSMDVEVPDVEESISLIEKIINAIKEFFNMIANMFK